MAGDYSVFRTTMNIPYPYPDGAAEKWIARHTLDYLERRHMTLAVRKHDGTLLGAVGLALCVEHRHAELGYWIGREYWNNGYCTEAAREMLAFGFGELELNRIFARHLGINPASGKVMHKIGMKREALLRQHYLKEGKLADVLCYAILRDEFAGLDQVRSMRLA